MKMEKSKMLTQFIPSHLSVLLTELHKRVKITGQNADLFFELFIRKFGELIEPVHDDHTEIV